MPPWHARISPSRVRYLLSRGAEASQALGATGRALFYFFAALIIFSSAGLLFIFNNAFLVQVPMRGGSYSEGIIGTPRFINPVLALSDADHDLTALVYSGLLKPSLDGTFEPDLADHYDISSDGKTYTVYLRQNAKFQDGSPVTADDVAFTISKVLDPAIKSPLRANWDGVSVAAVDAHTVQFVLSKPYAPFIENLTIGILPKQLWQNVNADEFPFSELNTSPIGSGPYKIDGVSRTSSGIPSSYSLSANSSYALGEPYITHFTLKFYQNEDELVSALQSGSVEGGSGISAASVSKLKNFHVVETPLSRVFGIFFNQNQNAILQQKDVRVALSQAIDREDLMHSVLSGYGEALGGPIPNSIYKPTLDASSSLQQASSSPSKDAAAARAYLLQKGWAVGPGGLLTKSTGSGKTKKTETLSLTLTTGNVPELTEAAHYIQSAWEQMGAKVDVQIFDQGDLSENVIRPRKYDALLFGEIVGRGLDLFAFWDSSERNDPGLNIALYANAKVDDLLGQLRQTSNDSDRQGLYQKITDQINADAPAVFLYSPDFLYIVPKDLQGMNLQYIDNPSDRFNDVEHWYLESDHVWKIFSHY